MTAAYMADEVNDFGIDIVNGDAPAFSPEGEEAQNITQGDRPNSPSQGPFTGLSKLLGSIGSTARDLGTAVGTVKRDVKRAGAEYRKAEDAAENGNKLQQWWKYSSDTDKLVVGLAFVGVAIAAYQAFKGK